MKKKNNNNYILYLIITLQLILKMPIISENYAIEVLKTSCADQPVHTHNCMSVLSQGLMPQPTIKVGIDRKHAGDFRSFDNDQKIKIVI